MLCDGRIVCGCADPYAKRVLGDVRTSTVAEIWTGPTARQLREDLNHGGSSFCGDCPLKLPLAPDEPVPQRDRGRRAAARPACTSSARRPATSRASSRAARPRRASRARGRPACSTGTCSRKAVDEAGPTLGRIDFFNYGEAFLHKRAVEMCEYIKSRFPHIYLYTSTNGLALTEEKARRLVHSGIDEVTFSIDGSSQDDLREVPAARQLRQGAGQPAGDGRREAEERARRAASELALHPLQLERLRRRDEPRAPARGGGRRRSPVLGD